MCPYRYYTLMRNARDRKHLRLQMVRHVEPRSVSDRAWRPIPLNQPRRAFSIFRGERARSGWTFAETSPRSFAVSLVQGPYCCSSGRYFSPSALIRPCGAAATGTSHFPTS